ncbi:FkbM family methyltransferase [Rhizobium sp. BK512]|uniref:FkbM family methyltransferase n=1 Tax=Rhizobium sp. BK512 TaxID=2587010 RepID=UPI000DDEA94D|nr:FkbM family methyltransferase [Rhizobium sp. BK512]MBB3561198.1 FkbM family methyltransferase [Rhizobium sp. BK512]
MFSTRTKIRIARCLSAIVLSIRHVFGLPDDVVVVRRGVRWSLDLKDGIDFAIYLLGGFEVRTLRKYATLIKTGDIILDIGANVGAHTLPLALLVGDSGRVHSFEPTAHAYSKQCANIALNPVLQSRIRANQMMLMASAESIVPAAVYSSWPLEKAEDLHGEHFGRLMSTDGALMDTVDRHVMGLGNPRIDFIKLDVDGNELDVLLGAQAVLKRSKPRIMLELAPYVYDQQPQKFDELLQVLWSCGYEISSVDSGRQLPRSPDAVRKAIPESGGMNVIASQKGVELTGAV